MNRFVSSLLLVAALAAAAHAGTADQALPGGDSRGLPLVASDELGVAGRTLTLEGLVSDGARTTGLALANLGGSAARCTVSLSAADGAAIGELATVGLAPRSHRYLDDVFAGREGVTGARAAVTCDQFIVDLAFPENKVPDEVPAFGWTFRDVHIEAFPK